MKPPSLKPERLQKSKNLIAFAVLCILFMCLQSPPATARSEGKAANNIFQIRPVENNFEKEITHFRFYKPDSAIHFIHLGLKTSLETKNFRRLGQLYNHLGIIEENRGVLDSAKKNYLKSISFFKKAGDTKGIANELNRLGVLSLRKANYPDAANHFYRALKIYQNNRYPSGIADTYLKIGAVHDRQQNFPAAIAYIRRAETIVEKLPLSSITLYVYSGLGNAYFKQGQYQRAASYYLQGLKLSNRAEYQSLNLSMTAGLASCLAKLGKSDQALRLLKGVLQKAVGTGLYDREIQIISALGDAHSEKNPDSAQYYYETAVAKSEFRGDIETAIRNLKALYELHYSRRNYQAALKTNQRERRLSDSLFNIQKMLQIADLEANHQLQDAKTSIQNLQLREKSIRTERYGIIFICIIVLVSMLFIILLYLRKRKLNNQLRAAVASLNTLNSELDQANQAKDKIFSIIAHDFRSPLSTIIGILELFRSDMLGATERREIAEKLFLQSTGAMELLNNLLTWGQAQLKGIQLDKQPLDMAEIAQRNIQLLEAQAQDKGIKVYSFLPSPTMVFADHPQVDFVVRNLLANAIKYGSHGGKVTIGTKEDHNPQYLSLSVSDNGIGMDRETVEKLFRLDVRSQTGTKGETGTGLGLIMCKSFIEANGGSISVESSKHHGTTFTIVLPRMIK